MKEVVCKICGGPHYKTWCPKAPRKPIKKKVITNTTKPLKCRTKALSGLKTQNKRKTVKRVSRKQLIKRLDTVFSQYIRIRDEVEGCVTCGAVKDWKEQQNGHFYTRGRYPTRWDEDNCHCQCVACNIFLKGNYINYTRYMIDRYGREFVDELEYRSLSNVKITSAELQTKIDYYKTKVKELLN